MTVVQASQGNDRETVNNQVSPSSDQNRRQIANENSETEKDDIVMVDLTLDHSDVSEENRNVFEENVIVLEESDRVGRCDPPETIQAKREREKAERPIRIEMRDFCISLWFRDYERYKHDLIDETERTECLMNSTLLEESK